MKIDQNPVKLGQTRPCGTGGAGDGSTVVLLSHKINTVKKKKTQNLPAAGVGVGGSGFACGAAAAAAAPGAPPPPATDHGPQRGLPGAAAGSATAGGVAPGGG